MVEREYEKFVELLTKLLNKYMESNTVSHSCGSLAGNIRECC